MRRAAAIALIVSLSALAPAGAEALTLKTNRGGACTVNPISQPAGAGVRYGVEIGPCDSRNGIRSASSVGFVVDDRRIVGTPLPRKTADVPYANVTTSAVDGTYTRVDYSIRLRGAKNRRQRLHPEVWRRHRGCEVETTRRTSDTIVCQSIEPT